MKEIVAEHAAKGNVLTPEELGAVTNRLKDMDNKARMEEATGNRYLSTVNNNEASRANSMISLQSRMLELSRRDVRSRDESRLCHGS